MPHVILLTTFAVTNIAAGIAIFHFLMLWKRAEHIYHYSLLDGVFEFCGMMETAYFVLLLGIAFTGLEGTPFFAGTGVSTWVVSTALVTALNRLFITRNMIVCLLAALLSNAVALGVLHILKQMLSAYTG